MQSRISAKQLVFLLLKVLDMTVSNHQGIRVCNQFCVEYDPVRMLRAVVDGTPSSKTTKARLSETYVQFIYQDNAISILPSSPIFWNTDENANTCQRISRFLTLDSIGRKYRPPVRRSSKEKEVNRRHKIRNRLS